MKRLLLCGILFLSAVVSYQILMFDAEVKVRAHGAAAGAPATDEPEPKFEFPLLSEFSEFIERPLFNTTRRPIQAQEDSTGKQIDKTSAGDFDLSGVSVAQGLKVALIKTRNDRKYHRLTEGDALKGWTIESIRVDNILVSDGGKEITLTLIRKGDGKARPRKPRRKVGAGASQRQQAVNKANSRTSANQETTQRITPEVLEKALQDGAIDIQDLQLEQE